MRLSLGAAVDLKAGHRWPAAAAAAARPRVPAPLHWEMAAARAGQKHIHTVSAAKVTLRRSVTAPAPAPAPTVLYVVTLQAAPSQPSRTSQPRRPGVRHRLMIERHVTDGDTGNGRHRRQPRRLIISVRPSALR